MTHPIFNAISVIACIAHDDDDALFQTLTSLDSSEVVPTLIYSIGVLEGVVKMLLDNLNEVGVETESYEGIVQFVGSEFAKLDMD